MTTTVSGTTGVSLAAEAQSVSALSVTGAGIADSTIPPTKLTQPLTFAVERATTTGTAIDFTGIPSWVTRINVMLAGVSVSGTSSMMIQLGDSGGVETTGYLGAATFSGGGGVSTNFTTGFGLNTNTSATNINHGVVQIMRMSASSNTWVYFSGVAFSESTNVSSGAGSKALSATLDRIRLTTVNGTDTFDAGSVNIVYE